MKKSTIAPITALDLQQERSVLLAVSYFSLDSFLLLFFSYPMPHAALHNTQAPLHHTTTSGETQASFLLKVEFVWQIKRWVGERKDNLYRLKLGHVKC